MEGEFHVNDLVFAKIRGYPFWPARVESISSETAGRQYSVFFYGTSQTGVCRKKGLIPYQEAKDKFGHYKNKKFHVALAEIEEVARRLKNGPRKRCNAKAKSRVNSGKVVKIKNNVNVLSKRRKKCVKGTLITKETTADKALHVKVRRQRSEKRKKNIKDAGSNHTIMAACDLHTGECKEQGMQQQRPRICIMARYNYNKEEKIKVSSSSGENVNILINRRLEDTATIQEDRATIQEDRVTIRDDRATVQENGVTLQEDRVTIQEDRAAIQEDGVIIQEDRVTIQKDGVTIQEDRVTTQEDRATIKEDGVTIQEDRVTIQQDRATIQEDRVTIQEDRVTIHEDRVTIQEDRATIQEDGVTIQEDRVTIQQDRATIQEDRVTIQEDRVTIQEDRVTIQEDRATIQEDGVTIQEDRVTIQQDRATIQEDRVTIQEDGVTIQEDRAPPPPKEHRVDKTLKRKAIWKCRPIGILTRIDCVKEKNTSHTLSAFNQENVDKNVMNLKTLYALHPFTAYKMIKGDIQKERPMITIMERNYYQK